MRRLSRFFVDDSGPAAVEYVLVLAIILGTLLAAVAAVMKSGIFGG